MMTNAKYAYDSQRQQAYPTDKYLDVRNTSYYEVSMFKADIWQQVAELDGNL